MTTTSDTMITYKDVLNRLLGEEVAATVTTTQPGAIMLLELAKEFARHTNNARRHLQAIQDDTQHALVADPLAAYNMAALSSSSSLSAYEASIGARDAVSHLMAGAKLAWIEDTAAAVTNA